MKQSENNEFTYKGAIYNGFLMLFINLIVIPLVIFGLVTTVPEDQIWMWIVVGLLALTFCVMGGGYFVQQPNQARVMIFFGKYCGTCRKTGYYWVNPLMTAKTISLRISNMDVAPIKVNDRVGNPVLIGMVLVWRVNDTYRATFDIDSDLHSFVSIQSDAALREVTGMFAYDEEGTHKDEITLRSGGDKIVELLEAKLNERLSIAGIEIVEARINYLAYAPEIAAVMLRRQQASAIISAREKIVEGAVSMVKMALNQLSEENVVTLDEERKAAMVSNLLVVLCADEPAQPVVNTGH
ncbi:MAG: SPFH domain-containing protein [Bacteroides sp.]|nr:SPFH domain-containing protein [Barnesiella sp.]MBD5315563.1 SPFH domain-containing protein [Bacteroides sp.]MDE7449429.1 SPFH domain-containing protein [Paramuribaculum sp.]